MNVDFRQRPERSQVHLLSLPRPVTGIAVDHPCREVLHRIDLILRRETIGERFEIEPLVGRAFERSVVQVEPVDVVASRHWNSPAILSAVASHRLRDVAVGVEGDGDGRVAELFLHDLRVHSHFERKRCHCVAEFVQPDLRRTRSLQHLVEQLGEALWVDLDASLINEHVSAVDPARPQRQPFLALPLQVTLQGRNCR